jgi:hypothetical protein
MRFPRFILRESPLRRLWKINLVCAARQSGSCELHPLQEEISFDIGPESYAGGRGARS